MQQPRLIVLLILDLIILVAVLLIFTYFGIAHLLLLLIGALIILTGFFDINTGIFSEVFQQYFNLPGNYSKGKILNLLPLLLSLIVIWYSIFQLMDHGLVNDAQKAIMQDNYSGEFIVAVMGVSAVIILIAAGAYRKKHDE